MNDENYSESYRKVLKSRGKAKQPEYQAYRRAEADLRDIARSSGGKAAVSVTVDQSVLDVIEATSKIFADVGRSSLINLALTRESLRLNKLLRDFYQDVKQPELTENAISRRKMKLIDDVVYGNSNSPVIESPTRGANHLSDELEGAIDE